MLLLSLEQMEAIATVVDTGSFRAAANRLHKAQSSISYLIKNLEQDLKIKIFNRDGYKAKLTEAGKVIYNKALSLLKINREIQDYTEFISQGIETKVSLVVSAVTPTQILMEIFKRFNKQFPKTQIELTFKTFEEPMEMLLAGEADIAITAGKRQDQDLESVKWNLIEFIPATTPQHAAASEDLKEDDLNNLTHLVVGGRSTLAKKSPKETVQNSNVWHITDFLIKKELLINGLGWGFMPKMLIDRELKEGLLVKVPAKDAMIKQLDLVRHKSNHIGPAKSYLWQLFTAYKARTNVVPIKQDLENHPLYQAPINRVLS